MRMLVAAAILFTCALPANAQYGYYTSGSTSLRGSYDQPVQVRAHVRSDGTYVPSHYRTRADSTQTNNWSSIPNVNPYTGEPGRRTPRY